MAEPAESRSRDHYKQSVVLQRTEGSDVQDPQMLRRRSLTIAHLYLTSASLSRTRTRSLTRSVSVQTSPTSDPAADSASDWGTKKSTGLHSRPKSEYSLYRPKVEFQGVEDSASHGVSETPDPPPPPQLRRPKSEHPLHRSRRGFSIDRSAREDAAPLHQPRVRFERPKSEHHSRRPLLEYRDVVIRESDQKRVVPRRPKTERPVSGSTSSKTNTTKRKP